MISSILSLLYYLCQDSHALLHRFLIPDSDLADSTDTLLDELRIKFIQILLYLIQYGFVVLVVNDPCQDLTVYHHSYIF